MFISVSGIDGSGKSTLIQGLEEASEAEGLIVAVFKNPTPEYRSNTHIARYRTHGRQDISFEAMALLSVYDRLTQYELEIAPRLRMGQAVIMDRYALDGIASFKYRGVDEQWLLQINSVVVRPDIEILLSCEPNDAFKRILTRHQELSYDERNVSVLSSKKRAYDTLDRLDGVLQLDSGEPKDKVFEHAWSYVQSLLRKRGELTRSVSRS